VDSEVHMTRRGQTNALLFFFSYFKDLQCGKGEWNFTQLSHVTVAKEEYFNFKFSTNNLLFRCVSELLKLSYFLK
jgi:hypothetical protein